MDARGFGGRSGFSHKDRRELGETEIDSASSASASLLPRLSDPFRPTGSGRQWEELAPLAAHVAAGGKFKCTCARVGVDGQRARYLLAIRDETTNPRQASSTRLEELAGCGVTRPPASHHEQLRWVPARGELATTSGWFRGRCRHDRAERALYKLEELLGEARRDLMHNLAVLVEPPVSAHHFAAAADSDGDGDNNGRNGRAEADYVMIRAPLPSSVVSSRRVDLAPKLEHKRFTYGGAWPATEESLDSGFTTSLSGDDDEDDQKDPKDDIKLPDLVVAAEHKHGRIQLEGWASFHGHPRVQLLVAHSLRLFRELIQGFPLFTKTTNLGGGSQTELMSLRQLEMLACVECQKLRACLRFEWMTKCLELAPLGGRDVAEIMGHHQAKTEAGLLDLLARLMGRLLRQHFLAAFLDDWRRLIEASLLEEKEEEEEDLYPPFRLLVPVELEPARDKVEAIGCSEPSAQIARTLATFMVAELAGVCCRLPRLEALVKALGSLGSPPLDPTSSHLRVLEGEGDSLLEDTERRLRQVIDGRLRRQSNGLILGSRQDSDIRPEYLELVELVESFKGAHHSYWSVASNSASLASRLGQLQAACSQLAMLRRQEGRLRCWQTDDKPLRRFYRLGKLVTLDYGPMRASLLQQLERERLLMTRLVRDDLGRLMRRLRLEFDEIELGLQLEAAVADYLAERRHWLAQQQHHHLYRHAGDDGDGSFGFDEAEASNDECGDEAAHRGVQEEAAEEPLDEHELFVGLVAGAAGGAAASMAQHLMAATLNGGAKAGDGGSGEQTMAPAAEANQEQVAPLIECRLLVAKFRYLGRLVGDELAKLREDVQVALEGLIFLSEFVEPTHEEDYEEDDGDADCYRDKEDHGHQKAAATQLIAGLAADARHLSGRLARGHTRLVEARERLVAHLGARSRVLSKLVVEFHLLMGDMAHRRLLQHNSGQQTARQLDSIQEQAAWAQELQLRHEFLWRQNGLLARESALLAECRQLSSNLVDVDVDKRTNSDKVTCETTAREDEAEEVATGARRRLLERWRRLVALVADLWRLAELFETQQVKWLSSDIKRLDYRHLERHFHLYELKLGELSRQLKEALELDDDDKDDLQVRATLELNLEELRQRLDHFRRLRLPLLKFLTNKHLAPAHWQRLNELLSSPSPLPSSEDASKQQGGLLRQQPQSCTTLAQFLDLHLDKFIGELEQMNREADLEHELSSFLASENGRRELEDKWRAWFVGWSDGDLKEVARRFLEMKLASRQALTRESVKPEELNSVAAHLVEIHSLVARHLRLSYHLNLDYPQREMITSKPPDEVLILRGHHTGGQLFVPLLRLVAESWLAGVESLELKLKEAHEELSRIERHLEGLGALVARAQQLGQKELRSAWEAGERALVELERARAALELERELLAAKEHLAIERQREALQQRDQCVRQLAERAIPAIRAAAKALDCLADGQSLRSLRSLRPRPPAPIQQVLEAVCLLRASSSASDDDATMKPVRRFDALRGRIVEDYWPAAARQLNGTLPNKLIADLRRVGYQPIDPQVMRLLRRRYLGSPRLALFASNSNSSLKGSHLARVSRDCFHLARWLLAVDVFQRVLEVVRPKYREYLESEKLVGELLGELAHRRRQLELVARELRQLEESLEVSLARRATLGRSLDDCRRQLASADSSARELQASRSRCQDQIRALAKRRARLGDRCAHRAARSLHLGALAPSEIEAIGGLLVALARRRRRRWRHTKPYQIL